MSKSWLVLLLCIVLAAGLLIGCGGEEDAGGVPEVKQEVTAGLGRDPAAQYNYGAHPPLTRVLETLIFRDLQLGNTEGLAVHWDVSDDNLTWTITLREGVSFHDGTPFNADAVVHNLERLVNGNPGTFGPVESMEADGDYKVNVKHSEPFAPFLFSLAWPGAAMISPDAIDEEGNVTEPVGTGPFIRESWTPDEEMVLVANEDYWGGAPRLKKVILKIIPDATTRMMALEAGEIDLIIDTGGVLPEQVETLQNNEKVEVLTVAGAVPHYMTINTGSAPFDDVRVRQALMYAIDPESIIRYTLEGFGEVMTSIIPFSEKTWMHADSLYSFNDPDKAANLLKEAGWERDGEGGNLFKDGREFRVKFLLSSSLTGRWPYQPIAEVIQAQLQELGIKVEIEIVEAGLWSETLKKGDAHLSIRPWAGLSPQLRLKDWLHTEGSNITNMGIFYSNPLMDELIEQILKTTDESEAIQMAAQVQELAARDLPLIPIYDEVLINAVRSNIKGYILHPWFTVNWEDIYVE